MEAYKTLIFYNAWSNRGETMIGLENGRTTGKKGNMYNHLASKMVESQQNLKLFRDLVCILGWEMERLIKKEVNSIKVKY